MTPEQATNYGQQLAHQLDDQLSIGDLAVVPLTPELWALRDYIDHGLTLHGWRILHQNEGTSQVVVRRNSEIGNEPPQGMDQLNDH